MSRLPLLAAAILCSCGLALCAPGDLYPEPWHYISDNGAVCSLLALDANIEVKYLKTDGNLDKLDIPIMSSYSLVNGSCGTNPEIRIPSKDYELRLRYGTDEINYNIEEMTVVLKKELFNGYNIGTPIIEFSFKNLSWKAELGNSVRCEDSKYNITVANDMTAELKINKIQTELFRDGTNTGIFREAVSCAPSESTTPVPTEPSPVPSELSPVPTGTTEPSTYTDDSEDVCTLLALDGNIKVGYLRTDGKFAKFDIPIRTTKTAITCDKDSLISIKTSKYDLKLQYGTDETNYYYLMTTNIELNKELFNGSNINRPITLSYPELTSNTKLGKSYSCGDISLVAKFKDVTAELKINKIQMELFKKTTDGTFSEAEYCSIGSSKPWSHHYYGSNTCIRADFDAELSFSYKTAAINSISKVVTVPKNASAIASRCGALEQSLTLTWLSNEIVLNYHKDEAPNKYQLKEMIIKLAESNFVDISTPLSKPVTFTYKSDVSPTSVGKSFTCDIVKAAVLAVDNNLVSGSLVLNNLQQEAFMNSTATKFSNSDTCIPTTAAPTSILPTDVLPTDNAAVGSPNSKSTSMMLSSNTTCIQVLFIANIHIKVNTTSGEKNYTVHVPTNGTITKNCGNTTQDLTFEWNSNDTASPNRLQLSFKKKVNTYNLALVNITLSTNLTGTLNLNHSGEELKTKLSHSYLCKKQFSFPLVSSLAMVTEANITFSEYHGEAFKTENGTDFSKNDGECGMQGTSNIPAIVVGSMAAVAGTGAVLYFFRDAIKKCMSSIFKRKTAINVEN